MDISFNETLLFDHCVQFLKLYYFFSVKNVFRSVHELQFCIRRGIWNEKKISINLNFDEVIPLLTVNGTRAGRISAPHIGHGFKAICLVTGSLNRKRHLVLGQRYHNVYTVDIFFFEVHYLVTEIELLWIWNTEANGSNPKTFYYCLFLMIYLCPINAARMFKNWTLNNQN